MKGWMTTGVSHKREIPVIYTHHTSKHRILKGDGYRPLEQAKKMHININTAQQTLTLASGEKTLAQYAISSAINGVGQQVNSEKTPLGQHKIHAKIGADLPDNAVLLGRVWTQEIYCPALAKTHPTRDWILTRILWLSGCEPVVNVGGDVDTLSRYIYIHGTPDKVPMGQASSRGCIRMHNCDILTLFDRVNVGDLVFIE
jgi:L,D-transpeptidase YbiS